MLFGSIAEHAYGNVKFLPLKLYLLAFGKPILPLLILAPAKHIEAFVPRENADTQHQEKKKREDKGTPSTPPQAERRYKVSRRNILWKKRIRHTPL